MITAATRAPAQLHPYERTADLLGLRFECILPIRIVSEANAREHWSVKRKRIELQHSIVRYYAADLRHVHHPTAVLLVRLAPKFLDSDNLVSGFKAVRDAIAEVYGVDDADWREGALQWDVPRQEKSAAYGVGVVVTGGMF